MRYILIDRISDSMPASHSAAPTHFFPSPSLSLSLSLSHLYLLTVLQGLHNGFVRRPSQHPLQLSHLLSVSQVMPCEEGREVETKEES